MSDIDEIRARLKMYKTDGDDYVCSNLVDATGDIEYLLTQLDEANKNFNEMAVDFRAVIAENAQLRAELEAMKPPRANSFEFTDLSRGFNEAWTGENVSEAD